MNPMDLNPADISKTYSGVLAQMLSDQGWRHENTTAIGPGGVRVVWQSNGITVNYPDRYSDERGAQVCLRLAGEYTMGAIADMALALDTTLTLARHRPDGAR